MSINRHVMLFSSSSNKGANSVWSSNISQYHARHTSDLKRVHLSAGKWRGAHGAWGNQLFFITLPNVERFWKVHWKETQQYVCNKIMVKYSTTPKSRCYTTLWCVVKNNAYFRLLLFFLTLVLHKVSLCWKFMAKSVCQRVLKIGQLWQRQRQNIVAPFSGHRVL